MKCPLCQVEMRISKSRYILEDDDTPEKNTKLYIEQDMSCMNKRCNNYDTVVTTVRNEVPIG